MAYRGNSFLADPLLRNPVFLACTAIYLLYRATLKSEPALVPELARNYLADFLCLPVILTLAVLIQRHLVIRNMDYSLNKWQVIFTVLYFSVLFELVFPHFYQRYTADILDVFCYAAGALVYWFTINPESAKEKK